MDIAATSLPRVIACNGSISMEASPASIDLPSEDREEGLAAHYVASAVLTGQISDANDYVGRATPNGIIVTSDMADHVGTFIDHLSGRGYTSQADFRVEQNADFAIPNSTVVIRARPDVSIFDPGANILYIPDFKYGWRIVEPFENWTLIAYAIAVMLRDNIRPDMIVFEICQPRPSHIDGPIREWSISADELTARFITLCGYMTGLTNMLATGPHCRKCKALGHCPSAKQAGYNAIEASTIAFSDQLSGDQLAFEIKTLRRAQEAIKLKLGAYEELATYRLETKGANEVPGFSVEMSLGNRAYIAGLTPETVSALTGKSIDEITTKKLVTPAALERLQVSEVVVKSMTYRPPTGKKLVEFDATKNAKKLFGTS